MRAPDRARPSTARRWPWPASELSLEERNIRFFMIDVAWQGLILGGISTFISVFVVRLGASNLQVSQTQWLDIRVVLYLAGAIHLLAALPFRLLHVGAEEHRTS